MYVELLSDWTIVKSLAFFKIVRFLTESSLGCGFGGDTIHVLTLSHF